MPLGRPLVPGSSSTTIAHTGAGVWAITPVVGALLCLKTQDWVRSRLRTPPCTGPAPHPCEYQQLAPHMHFPVAHHLSHLLPSCSSTTRRACAHEQGRRQAQQQLPADSPQQNLSKAARRACFPACAPAWAAACPVPAAAAGAAAHAGACGVHGRRCCVHTAHTAHAGARGCRLPGSTCQLHACAWRHPRGTTHPASVPLTT